jgi:hypothetical protein
LVARWRGEGGTGEHGGERDLKELADCAATREGLIFNGSAHGDSVRGLFTHTTCVCRGWLLALDIDLLGPALWPPPSDALEALITQPRRLDVPFRASLRATLSNKRGTRFELDPMPSSN